MNHTVEMDKTAEPAVPNVPPAERLPDTPALPSREERNEARDHETPEPAITLSSSSTFTTAIATKETTSTVAETSAAERVARAVMDGVAHLRQTGKESLSVTLKPDATTELVLRVELRDGALSAQLHFAQGDRTGLEQHWDELHRRLAEQGVRLSRGDDFGAGADAHSGRSQEHSSKNDESVFPTRTLSTNPGQSNNTAPTSRSSSGFETWA